MTDPVFLEGDAIRVERRYDHPIERVWAGGDDAGGPRGVVPRPGPVRGRASPTSVTTRARVLAFEPPHRLVFTWGDDQLEFELRAEGDGTVFVLTHTFSDRAGAASFASGWENCLQVLSLVLAGKPRAGAGPVRGAPRGAGAGVRARRADRDPGRQGLERADRASARRARRGRVGAARRRGRSTCRTCWSASATGPATARGSSSPSTARRRRQLEPATAWVRAAVARAAAG